MKAFGRTAGALVASMSLTGLLGVPAAQAQDSSTEPVIVFASDRDGDWDLYATGPDGAGLAQLTDNEVDDVSPAPSPDGALLAYRRGDELVLANSDGSNPTVLAGSYVAGWSHDGTKLAVDGDDGVLIYDRDGTLVTRVPCDFCTTSWAPDGRLVLDEHGSGPSLFDLSTMTRTALPEAPIAWSPDGATFAAIRNGSLVALRLDGSGRRTIATKVNHDAEVRWSPDGSRVVYSTGTGPEASEIFVLDSDGHRSQLTTTEAGERSSSPRWSPDGKTVVYLRGRYATDPYSNRDVYAVSAPGGRPVPITTAFPDGGDNDSPGWATGAAPPPRQALPSVRLQSRSYWSGAGVGELDSSGTTVAFEAVAPGHSCGPVRLWRALDGRAMSVPGLCSTSVASPGSEIHDLVLEDERLAWLYRFVDRGEGDDCLFVVRVSSALNGASTFGPRNRRRCLAVSWNPLEGAPAFHAVYNGGTRYEGDTFEHLEGTGSLLVYSAQHHCPYGPACDRPATGPETARLFRVARTGPARMASGSLASHPVDVNAGRILLLAPDGDLLLMDRRGRLGTRFGFAQGVVEDAMLDGSTLVAVTSDELAVIDIATGERRATWPIDSALGPPPRLEGLQAGIAVYATGVALHLVRLADGRDAVVEIDHQGGPTHARLEPAGLYYSYNKTHSRRPGRIAFVPFGDVERALETVPYDSSAGAPSAPATTRSVRSTSRVS